MAASKILVWEDPRRIDKAGHLIFPGRPESRARHRRARIVGQFDREEEVLWPDGCAALYRHRMLDQIGGFDEDFFAYGDDAELGLRARIAGWKCLYTPEAVVRHHRGATLGKGSACAPRADRAQPPAAGVEAVSLEPAVAESVFLRGAGGGGVPRRRGAATAIRPIFPALRGKWRMARALSAAATWGAAPGPAHAAQARRDWPDLRRLSPREVRRLILAHRLSLRETT